MMKPEEMPCCVAHKGPSCIDRTVANCVCKKRPSCCTQDWGATCIQVMVDNGCGMCSRDALKATPFLDGSVQTGGRTADQVYVGQLPSRCVHASECCAVAQHMRGKFAVSRFCA